MNIWLTVATTHLSLRSMFHSTSKIKFSLTFIFFKPTVTQELRHLRSSCVGWISMSQLVTWNKSVLARYAETFLITVHVNQAAQLSQCYPGTSINSLSTQAYMQTCSELLFASYISNNSTLAHTKYICQFAEKDR